MRISSPHNVGLAMALALLITGCVPLSPGMPPATATRMTEAVTTRAPDVQALADQFVAEYGLVLDPARSVAVRQLDAVEPLFVVYTVGNPPEDADDSYQHRLSLHVPTADGWLEKGRVALECVNYLDEDALEQAPIEPSSVWLTVQGGAGAHSGCLELLRWDGQTLSLVISGFNSSPDAGAVTDLNGDGRLDLLLNDTDPYIFCYACGVRLYRARFFHWDGQGLVETPPTRLSDDYATDLRAVNDRAVALAAASLFADALAQIEQAEALDPENPTVHWNAVWIRHHLEASRQLASTSAFPLLNHVFAGDWEAAFDALWESGLTTFTGDTPIASASAAFGFEETVGELLIEYAERALGLQAERAAVHALGAWGGYLLNRDDLAVVAGFRQAAELATADGRYSEIVAAFDSRKADASRSEDVEAQLGSTPDVQALADQLTAEYGLQEDLVAVQQIDSVDEQTLFVAHTYGFPPDDSFYMPQVSLHRSTADGWAELGRVELECANYLDETSLEQASIEPASVWLTVQGLAGAHSGCLELLRWDGQTLSLVISGFNSSPDAGYVTDLNGDGRLDLLLNDTDPYIFCYACGVRLYRARFFHWDGQGLVETPPTRLSDDYAADLRAVNDRAVALAAASLFADALAQIEQAEALDPENPTVHWNAVWIRHHLEASRQLASSRSAFPLLNHVFAGDWEMAFDALWESGLTTFTGDTPIANESAAFGFEETVGELLIEYAERALGLQAERAAVHALGAWGGYLLNRDDPAVVAGFRQAAELASADGRYSEIVAAFTAAASGR